MSEREALVLYLRIIGARRRIRAWETLPEHPFREKMIQKEQAILARLEAQKEAA